MSQIGDILEAMRAGMQAGLPNRIVTRTLKDFADRDEPELQKGVYTLLCKGMSGDTIYRKYVDILLVGQVKTADGAGGAAIEEAELSMIDEVLQFQTAIKYNVQFEITQSRQLEAPYGWISAESRVGPFDFSQPASGTGIGDFILFHAESSFGGTADDPVLISEETLPQ